MIIALNIALVAIVLIAIVGGLAWSIRSQNVNAPAGLTRTARRRQRTTARAQFIGRSVQSRA